MLWSIGGYQTILRSPLTNIKWHSLTWPYTMTTHYWSDFVPNSTFFRIWVVSIEHLRRAWHADRGRLLLHTPGPIHLGLAYVLLVENNPFYELIVIFPDYALRIFLCTISILLHYVIHPAKTAKSSISNKNQYHMLAVNLKTIVAKKPRIHHFNTYQQSIVHKTFQDFADFFLITCILVC